MLTVLDCRGESKGVTYAKRAKGLVKHGRARYLDARTIELYDITSKAQGACSPLNIDNSEDKMNKTDKIYDNDGNIVAKVTEDVKNVSVDEIGAETGRLTALDILSRLDRVIADGEYIKQTLNNLISAECKDTVHAAENVIKAREATNHRVVTLLETMYRDLSSKSKTSAEEALEMVRKTVTDPSVGTEIKRSMLEHYWAHFDAGK